MYKTIWAIKIDNQYNVKFTYYHFGKTPQFPNWYMEENHWYEIELLWNVKLISTLKIFLKCLFKHYIIQGD